MQKKDIKNRAIIVGDLIGKEVTRKNVGKADESISLKTTIRVSDTESHELFHYAYRYRMDENKKRLTTNEENKLWKGYDKVSHYVALSDKGNDTGECTKIKATGKLNINRYISKNSGELVETPNIRGQFCEEAKAGDKNCAVWVGTMYISEMIDAEDEVGEEYTKLIGLIPDTYAGADEYEFRVYGDKKRAGFARAYDAGEMEEFEGTVECKVINNTTVEEEVEEDGGWEEEMDVSAMASTRVIRYFDIKKSTHAVLGDETEDDHVFHEDKIAEYRKDIKAKKLKVKEDAKNKEQEEKASKVTPKDPIKGVSIDDDDVPF